MNKIILLTISLIITISLKAYNQDTIKLNNIYFKAKVFDEFSFGYERIISKDFSVSFELGYNFGGEKNKYASNGGFFPFTQTQIADFGPSIGMSLNNILRKNRRLSFDIFYRDLTSLHLIYDPGQFAGTNGSPYSEYDLRSRETGMLFSYSGQIFKPVFYKIGLGIQTSLMTKHYYVEGTYSSQKPSDRICNSSQVMPFIRFDLIFNLVKF